MTERFLDGRQAFVTGGTSGIGLAIAQGLAGAGARVAINGLGDAAAIDAALAALKKAGAPDARHWGADLRDPDAIAAMLEELAAWGHTDIVVNSAGMQFTASVASMPRERWDAILAINLSAAFQTMQALMPPMAERGFGRIINIASVHGLVASVQKAPYVASKFGLIGLTKVAALEYAAAGSRDSGGVTANCICPGWVETPLIEAQIQARAAQHGNDRAAGIADLLSEKQPSRRMSSTDDIAALALFLCRREAHNINGASLPVDGAWTAQ